MELKQLLLKCGGCHHYTPTHIFDLCDHASSAYVADGKAGIHTIQHMRKYGCQKEAVLFKKD